jgi:hypothetical protein
VLDTLWKKTLPSKLFHLERVSRRPDNLPLPTSTTSLTWREVIHKLSIGLLWPVCHAQTSTAWPQQPIGKTNTGFLTGSTMAGHFLFLNPTTRDRLTLGFSGTRDKQSMQGQHRFELFRQELYQGISEVHTGFSAFRDEPGYSCRGRTGSTLRGSGPNGERSPHAVHLGDYICMHQG